ncbi:MAG: ABC transporter permease, partial [Clostridia bacterium]
RFRSGNVNMTATIKKESSKDFTFLPYMEEVAENISEEFGTEQLDFIKEIQMTSVYLDLENNDGTSEDVKVGFISDLDEHSEIIYGEMYSNTLESDGSIGVIVSEAMLASKDLLVGESYLLKNVLDENGDGYRVTIKGVFTNSSDSDVYWVNSPSSYSKSVLMDEDLFRELFLTGETAANSMTIKYTAQLDYTAISSSNVANMLSVITEYSESFENMGDMSFSTEFTEIFESHLAQETELNVTLLVLQVPIFILLAVFIYMVSSQILELEQSEISIFKSRGASKGQIISIYLLQSGMISLLSLLVGIPFGYLICHVLGSSNAFLEFVNRSSLPASITVEAVIYSLIAVFFSVITMVFPVFKYSNIGIVAAKRKKQQKFKFKLWEKLCIDFICIAISLYGLYSVNEQKDLIVQKIANGENLDPIIFLYSSIFIIGVGLFSLRIFPWIMKLIFFIGKKKWSPSIFLSFKRVISGNDKQGFIMLFLVLTISLGTFNAVTARTINSNEENSISYDNGADIVMQQTWSSATDEMGESTGELIEPNYAIYSEMDGVDSYAKVYTNDEVTVSLDDIKLENVSLMGIDTKDFGETAYFDTDLLPYHWYEYLNAISQNPKAILMSSNARDIGGLEIGDSITYYDSSLQESTQGVIYGFVDYWPSYSPVTLGLSGDGTTTEINHYLIVANLSQVQAELGIAPYEIWINVTDSTSPVYEFIEENNISVSAFTDTQADIISQKNDPLFQGTNGILTVGFITVLALCTVGFLIYWILSMISRQLQFGIFRAMGMSMKEILLMLVNEQICVSGYGILIGALVGYVASQLFVPLIQLTYAAADQAIPLEIISETSDNIKIFIVIALMITVCMAVISVMISKLKITQVLKLGED